MAMERDLPSERGETGLESDYQLGREKGQEEEEEGGGGGGGRRRRMRKRRRGQRACESGVDASIAAVLSLSLTLSSLVSLLLVTWKK